MILTDREWLRFVTFALAAGIVLGSIYTGALVTYGRGPPEAMVGALFGGGLLTVAFHLLGRSLLNRALEPAADTDAEDTTA